MYTSSFVKGHIKLYDGHDRCENLKISRINVSYHDNEYHIFEIYSNDFDKLETLIRNDFEQYNYEFNINKEKDFCTFKVYNLSNNHK